MCPIGLVTISNSIHVCMLIKSFICSMSCFNVRYAYTMFIKSYDIHDSNLATKFVWVRKGANPHGPKRVWVPKTTPIVFDVGVGSRMT